MMLCIKLEKVQTISSLNFSIDIDRPGLTCITGKNGVGKTTLIKSIRNFVSADTFRKTSSEDIFNVDSVIEYEFNGQKVRYEFDSSLSTLNSRSVVPSSVRSKIAVELPIPHGERFNFFQSVGGADADIRLSISIEEYSRPEELIEFLQGIYSYASFENLIEVTVKKSTFFCKLLPNGRYLREDYFSSGEYFLISLYRRIVSGHKFIVIDEIDISLDAAAQVSLVEKLRHFGEKYTVGILFTTHSLAMMRTLKNEELFYMDYDATSGVTSIINVPYSYVKSILFGFTGWDRYILTEDDVLKEFIEYVILNYCGPLFYQYKIIFIGGSSNTTDLMLRNRDDQFFSRSENVICVLDGDQKEYRHGQLHGVYCMPLDSIEKCLLAYCLSGGFSVKIDLSKVLNEDLDRLRRYLISSPSAKKSTIKTDPFVVSNRFHRAYLIFINKFFPTAERTQLIKSRGDVSSEKEYKTAGKKLFKYVLKNRLYSKSEIFKTLCNENSAAISGFAYDLRRFLTVSEIASEL